MCIKSIRAEKMERWWSSRPWESNHPRAGSILPYHLSQLESRQLSNAIENQPLEWHIRPSILTYAQDLYMSTTLLFKGDILVFHGYEWQNTLLEPTVQSKVCVGISCFKWAFETVWLKRELLCWINLLISFYLVIVGLLLKTNYEC